MQQMTVSRHWLWIPRQRVRHVFAPMSPPGSPFLRGAGPALPLTLPAAPRRSQHVVSLADIAGCGCSAAPLSTPPPPPPPRSASTAHPPPRLEVRRERHRLSPEGSGKREARAVSYRARSPAVHTEPTQPSNCPDASPRPFLQHTTSCKKSCK